MRNKMIKPKEKTVHQQVCDYIKLQYPNIIFTSDASGMRVGIGLRMELKRKRCKHYVIPDLLILQPNKHYHGLIIEIKKDISDVYLKSMEVKSTKHLQEQLRTINKLNSIGYAAFWGCGFDACKNIIDDYLK